MKIYLATDHAGFEHKEALREFLTECNHEVIDCGAHTYDAEDDYPAFIKKAVVPVSENPDTTCAVIFGGSGQGEAMVANRFPRVRATVYYGGPRELITLSREHNNANVLSIGARFVSHEAMKEVVLMWLNTPFKKDERHMRRIAQIDT